MTDPDVPLTTRGVRRTRFNPLRDVPDGNSAGTSPEEAFLAEFGLENAENGPDEAGVAEKRVLSVVSAVRRQIVALGLAESPEGAMAVALAEKAEEATGSAAAACLHELRMVMDAIRAAKPAAKPSDPTEDVLARKRERKAGA